MTSTDAKIEPVIAAPAVAVVQEEPAAAPQEETIEEKWARLTKETREQRAREIAELENRETVAQSFEKFRKESPIEGWTLEDEATRFFYVRAAQDDVAHKRLPLQVLQQLLHAKKPDDLAFVSTLMQTTSSRRTADAIKGGALKFIEQTDRKLAELMEKCRKVQLKPEEVEEKFIKPAAIERLKTENPNLNVMVEFDPDNTQYMQKLRAAAVAASSAVSDGMPIAGTIEGEQDDNAKKIAAASVHAATVAIRAYEEAKDVITREDGDETVVVGNLFYTSYLEAERKRNNVLEDFRKEQWFTVDAMRTIMAIQAEQVSYTIAMLPVVDCAVFVPRLALLLCGQPLPRVVEASRIYRIYVAAMTLIHLNLPLLPQKEFASQMTRKLKKMTKETGVQLDVKVANLPQYAYGGDISQEMHDENFARLHASAMHDWFEMKSKARADYARESECRANPELAVAKSRLVPGLLEKCPRAIEFFFYGAMWHASQHTFIGLLHKFEACIIKRLHRFLDGGSLDYLCTRRKLPVKGYAFTTQLLAKSNSELIQMRQKYIDAAKTLPAYQAVAPKIELKDVPLGDTTEFDEKLGFEAQAWSPTIGQLKQYVLQIEHLSEAPPNVQEVLSTLRPAFSEVNLKTQKQGKKKQNQK
jgi:hypothetical protein